MSRRRTSIRSLRPGEVVPTWAPRRYRTVDGYVVLRWRIAPGRYVEIREHRVFDGRVTTAPEVHHINGDRTDNRPENLLAVDSVEHKRHHRRIDRDLVRSMYSDGLTLPQIAEELGCSHSHLSRVLRDTGAQARPKPCTPINADELRALAASGDVRVPQLAEHFGVGHAVIRRAMRDFEIPAFPAGRPRKVA